MTPFDEILNTIEQIHLKNPPVSFGKLLDCLTANNEHLVNLDNSEVLKRLKYILQYANGEESQYEI
jgi:hypothetical protein